jgi:hypothetical protein
MGSTESAGANRRLTLHFTAKSEGEYAATWPSDTDKRQVLFPNS